MRDLNLKPHPLLLLPIIFLMLSPTFFSPSHAEGGDDETIIAWKRERSHYLDNNNTIFITLAAKRTRRVDPTNNFQYYESGWDITNPHYHTSLFYSGAPLLYLAAVWFLGVIVFFLIALCCFCCCSKNRRRSYSRIVYWGSLIYIVLFLLVAMATILITLRVGAVLLYTGQGKFRRATNEVINNVARRLSDVLDTLNNVLNNLDGAMKLAVGAFSLPAEYGNNTDQFRGLVHSNSSTNPRIVLETVIAHADKFLGGLSYSLIFVTAVMLILAILGFIISVCGWQGLVYLLFFIGWILVTATLILCAISYVVQNGVGDACVAMEEWLQHPTDRTSLNHVLPCVDGPTEQKALYITRNTSFQMANLVNNFVTNMANADLPPGAPPSASYNQSGPLLPLLCNPFYPDMNERPCATQEVRLDNASQTYQSFVCKTSPDGRCMSVGRLTPDLYQQIMMATNVSNTLYQDGPKLIELIDGTFVAETFDEISKRYCPLMRRFSGLIFVGLLLLSLALMFSLILWVVFVRHRQGQISSNHFR